VRRVLTLLFVLASAFHVSAQVDFRSGVDLVALNVVVTDPEQKFVGGLEPGQFTVLEDGVPQQVSFFAASDVPVDLALLLDTSSSMSNKMGSVQEAAIGFASTIRPGDRLAVVDIKEGMKLLHPFSGDVAAAQTAIRQTSARGGTALYNGLYLTLREMVKDRAGRTEMRRGAIVVLSDGDDTASLLGFEEVMELAKQAGIAIYTIALREPIDVSRQLTDRGRSVSQAEFAMRSLAQETGARSYFPADISELAGVYDSIAQELAHQYSIGYSPKNVRRDGAYRRLLVRVSEPGVRIRTRAGYIASGARNY
jgi:Ca-activated chloride channel family protein